MQYAKYLLFVLGLGFAGVGCAQTHIHECIACTDAEYERKAITLDVGVHYFYDFNRNEIRRYQVQRVEVETPGSADTPSIFELQLTRQPVPEKMQKTFAARRNVWVLVNNHTAIIPLAEVDRNMTLDPADPDVSERLRKRTSLEIVMFEALQYKLSGYLRSELLEIATMPNGEPATEASPVQIKFDTDVEQLIFTLAMPAGGTVDIRYDPDPDAGSIEKFAYVEQASIDAAGNRIPEPGQADHVPGTYSFDTSEQFQALGKYLTTLMPNVAWPEAFCPTVHCPPRRLEAGDGLSWAQAPIKCNCRVGPD